MKPVILDWLFLFHHYKAKWGPIRFHYQCKNGERYIIVIVIMVMVDIPTGTQTGAIHGLGIRNRTSIVVKFGGHFIKI